MAIKAAIIIATLLIIVREGKSCGLNAEYKTCGSACEATCENRGQPGICIQQCVPGCFCKEGFVKRSDGKCVPLSLCEVREDKSCGLNAEYKSCGSACEATCENRGQPGICIQQCVPGCFCKEGFVKRSDGKCVPLNSCGVRGEKQCGLNAEYKTCGSACEATCENRGQTGICTQQCVPGCFCKEGFVKRSDGKCVPLSLCGVIQAKSCGQKEEYRRCGSACVATCENRGHVGICTKQCVPGCFCKRGLVRRSDGKCVPLSLCGVSNHDPICRQNQVFQSCGTACPPTCDNRNPICIQSCVSGCFCKPGYVVKKNKCVPVSEC